LIDSSTQITHKCGDKDWDSDFDDVLFALANDVSPDNKDDLHAQEEVNASKDAGAGSQDAKISNNKTRFSADKIIILPQFPAAVFSRGAASVIVLRSYFTSYLGVLVSR